MNLIGSKYFMTIVQSKNISLNRISKSEIECIAKNVLRYLEHSESDVIICFTNDRTIKKLNRQFRGFDESTDVLSFPYKEIDIESGRLYLGDIIISLEKANLRAEKKGWELIKEIRLLIVHGILHLLDYDHENPKDSNQMAIKQDEILNYLNS
ncbi:MAG: rRNA maturation RNase YbeY [Bacteroidales bacterium]|nr:rRNA maturation RNase YbeY [Bacteroidales bacterium]